MKVPRVKFKPRVFSFKIQFCSQVSELRRDLNTVNSASQEVLLLDSLLKLADTQARNNKITLVHYLCKVLAEKLSELLDFPKDPRVFGGFSS